MFRIVAIESSSKVDLLSQSTWFEGNWHVLTTDSAEGRPQVTYENPDEANGVDPGY